MRFDIERPIYLQIEERVKGWVFAGVYGPGDRVPSVRELAKKMKVNPNTVAKAYYELEREGFLVTKRGEGTFITKDEKTIEKERKRMLSYRIKKFVEDLKELGINERKIEKIKKMMEEI